MSVDAELLARVRHALADGNARRPDLARRLRDVFPAVSFCVCDDDDVPARLSPLAEGEGFALYGIHTGGHCASLTGNLEHAGGIAVALRDDHV